MQTKHRVLSLIVGVLAIAAFAIPEANAAVAHLWHVGGLDLSPLVAFAVVAGPGVRLRELNSKRAALVETMQALNAKADFDESTDGLTYAAHKADLDKINAAIGRESELIAESARAGIAGVLGASVEDNVEQDPTRGFASFGHFASLVGKASLGDRRAAGQLQAAAPSTFGNENTGQDGGFAIPPQFSQDIWSLSLGEDSLIPLTSNTEITGNSMLFPKDETTPWGGTGIQAYWQAEAKAASESKPVLGSDTLSLHKLMVLVPATNELVADGFAIGSYLTENAPSRITYKTNEAILYGDGVGKPLGALKGGGVVVQAKEGSQASGSLVAANISNMVSRLLVGELKNAIWLGNPDILTPLEGLTVGNYPIFLPLQSASSSSYGMLKGRPLNLSEHASALGDQGDISLLSLKGYRTITQAGGIQTATSMHLYFDADAMAFRFTYRINGKPILSKPVTPPKSSNTRSHFVTLAARA
jgi:HK97 family phage major capsid protein